MDWTGVLKHWHQHCSTVCSQLLSYSSSTTRSFAVMNTRVPSSFIPKYKLTFQMLLNSSLVAVASFPLCPPSASLFSPLSSFCLTLWVIICNVALCFALTFAGFLFLWAMPHRKLLELAFSWCCSSHARAGGWLSFLCWRKHQAGKGLPDVSYIAWKLRGGVFPVLHLGGASPWGKKTTSQEVRTGIQGMASHPFELGLTESGQAHASFPLPCPPAYLERKTQHLMCACLAGEERPAQAQGKVGSRSEPGVIFAVPVGPSRTVRSSGCGQQERGWSCGCGCQQWVAVVKRVWIE